MANRGESLFMRHVPVELRERIIDDAAVNDSNVNDTVARVLSGVYGVPHEPTGRRAPPAGTKDPSKMCVRISAALAFRIQQTALARKQTGAKQWTWNDEARTALCAHYGVAAPVVPRRVGGRRRRTVAA